jgi:hypothetical protein
MPKLTNYRALPAPTPSGKTTTTTIPAPALWAVSSLNFHPDPLQSRVLDSAHRRVLVNCCRQWGKSTTAALRALHHAYHHPHSETILIAPTQRQSAELLTKVYSLALRLPSLTLRADSTHRHSLRFPNRSRILALPGKRDNIRGFSRVSLLIIDEAAWVPDPLYFAVRPFLAAAPDASLLVLSTPNGDSGFFHHAWHSSQSWLRISVPATDCPRISPAFLNEERATLTRAVFDQEYMCSFLSHQRAVFPTELLDEFFSRPHFLSSPSGDAK